MLCAPYGVFALLASLIVEAPNIDLLKVITLLCHSFGRFIHCDNCISYDCKIFPKKKFKGIY